MTSANQNYKRVEMALIAVGAELLTNSHADYCREPNICREGCKLICGGSD